MSPQTSVASFILRFVQQATPDTAAEHARANWHGIIKHVQTNHEQHFTSFSEAVAFIANFVNLDEFGEKDTTESLSPTDGL